MNIFLFVSQEVQEPFDSGFVKSHIKVNLMFLYFILQQKCKTGVLLQPQKGFDPASEHNNKMPELFSASFSSSPILELCKKVFHVIMYYFALLTVKNKIWKHQEL